MQWDLIWRLFCIAMGWELWIILWSLYVDGTLLINDFDPAEGDPNAPPPADELPADQPPADQPPAA